jgi:tRNA(Ile)-lysidine synthase
MALCLPFESSPVIAVAVSGGADSMALLLLAQAWAQKQGGSVMALTVDHGLRAASGAEAMQVHAWCTALGIPHHILNWQSPALSSAIQASARDARYRLMAGWCRQHHVLHLLTAHHRDDQAETLFFRLARGSGLDGLACMTEISHTHDIRLLRPLLGVSKARLVATLEAARQPWLDDPSNSSPHYTRNLLRHRLQQAPHYEELAERAFDLTRYFGLIRNALLNNTVGQLTQGVFLAPEGYAAIDMKTFSQLPQELAQRLLAALCQTLAGQEQAPRSEKLQRLYENLGSSRPARRQSFGGLLFTPRLSRNHWLVSREPKAMEEEMTLPAGETRLWDQRFRVCYQGKSDDFSSLTVKGLGGIGARMMLKEAPARLKNMEKPALLALPSFWHLETLLAVPHIHYHHPSVAKLMFHAPFCPAKPLAGRLFFSMNTQDKK